MLKSPLSLLFVLVLLTPGISWALDPPRCEFSWGRYGTAPGEFRCPHGIAVDANGNVYVADYTNQRIQVFNPNGQFLRTWNAASPFCLAVAPDGSIFVGGSFKITSYTSGGTLIRSWGQSGTQPGQLYSVRGVAVSNDGQVYVADGGNHRIHQFTTEGVFVRSWGGFGVDPGLFVGPSGIVLDGDGNVCVSDPSAIIQRFSPTGVLLDRVELDPAEGAGDDLGIDPQGNLYYVESSNRRVLVASPVGTFLFWLGASGSSSCLLGNPRSVALAADGTVYISDSLNHRIQKLSYVTAVQPTTWGLLKTRYTR